MSELDTLLTTSTAAGTRIETQVRGRIDADERDCARAMIAAVVARHGMAGGARLRLTGGHCTGGPALVQVNLRVCGAPARVQVGGRTVVDAISAGAVRLDRQIRRLHTAWEPWPWPDPERRALSVPGRGKITRRKPVALRPRRSCQAGSFLAAMDYDVCLFTDVETGEDAVIYRAGPTGLRVARQRSMRPTGMSGTPTPTVNSRKISVITPEEAAGQLAEGWLPFLFFTDRDSGRGNLVYRRYDGGVGLITPASSHVRR